MDEELMMKFIVMPYNLNPDGDIYAGWLLSKMDLAGYTACKDYFQGRYVTIAINDTYFKQPVFVGDNLSIYTKIIDIGKTSLHIYIKVCTKRIDDTLKNNDIIVTEGTFKYVHIDNNRMPLVIKKKLKKFGDLKKDFLIFYIFTKS